MTRRTVTIAVGTLAVIATVAGMVLYLSNRGTDKHVMTVWLEKGYREQRGNCALEEVRVVVRDGAGRIVTTGVAHRSPRASFCSVVRLSVPETDVYQLQAEGLPREIVSFKEMKGWGWEHSLFDAQAFREGVQADLEEARVRENRADAEEWAAEQRQEGLAYCDLGLSYFHPLEDAPGGIDGRAWCERMRKATP